MIKRTMLAALTFAVSTSVLAAPKWVELPYSTADASFIDHSSIVPEGKYVDINVLRNFDETIVLGNDPVTGAPMYSHRSVKLAYVVDCEVREVALTNWKMFDGNFGSGEVVWADTNWGELDFTPAHDEESRSVLISACATALAANQTLNAIY